MALQVVGIGLLKELFYSHEDRFVLREILSLLLTNFDDLLLICITILRILDCLRLNGNGICSTNHIVPTQAFDITRSH